MDYKAKFDQLVEKEQYLAAYQHLQEHAIHAYEDNFINANMGWILNQLRRYEEALAYLRKALRQDEKDGWIYGQIGFAYNHLDDVQNSLFYLRKALEYGEDVAWVHAEIGYAYHVQGAYKRAIEAYQKIKTISGSKNNVPNVCLRSRNMRKLRSCLDK